MSEAFPAVFAALESAPPDRRTIPGVSVDWVWAQDKARAEHLADVCYVDNVADRSEQLLGQVDAVMITEDAADAHLPLSEPFIEARLPLYIDRPLARQWEDVRAIWAKTGPGYPLLSCSSLRYAAEVQSLKTLKTATEEPVLFRAFANLNWFGYSTHLVEALVQVLGNDPIMTEAFGERDDSFVLVGYPGKRVGLIHIIDLPAPTTLRFSLHCKEHHKAVDWVDIYERVYAMLKDFLSIVEAGASPRRWLEDTLAVMRILVGAQRSREQNNRRMSLGEFVLD
jgi:hypothetical protein